MRQVKELKTITITKYEASDGCRFDTEQECIDHEATIGAKRELAQSIEHISCWIPFSGWDMEPDESKLYLINSAEEFDALVDMYIEDYGSDADYLNLISQYPAVYFILARESFVTGYELDEGDVDFMRKTADLINEYLCKAKQEVINHENNY